MDGGQRILLAKQTEKGLLPGRITGLLVEARPGEPPAEAAVRAAREVAGLELGPEAARLLELRAVLDFHESDVPGAVFEEHEFVLRRERAAEGGVPEALFASLAASAEPGVDGRPGLVPEFEAPAWHALSEIPYGAMPADDRVWYPLALRGEPRLLLGRFWVHGPDLMQHELWWQ